MQIWQIVVPVRVSTIKYAYAHFVGWLTEMLSREMVVFTIFFKCEIVYT